MLTDEKLGWNWYSKLPSPIFVPATPERLAQLYQQLQSQPGYRALLDSNVSIFGAIDDHDYGINNGDKTYVYKRESAMAYTKFLGLDPEQSAMARRAHDGHGIYGVQLYDFERALGDELVPEEESGLDPDVTFDAATDTPFSAQSVAIFVLDVRSHKTPWATRIPSSYYPDPQGDFLGERQWRWLEEGLRRSRASVNIIVQGLQVHPDRYPDGNIAEAWSRFPTAQQRLYQALLQPNVQAPMIVSGDVHMAQLMKKECHQPQAGWKPLVEITTSGMTHAWGAKNVCSTPSRTCRLSYIKWASKTAMHFSHWFSPWTDLLIKKGGEDSDTAGKDGLQYSLDLNFAEFEFDWDQKQVVVRILGEDEHIHLAKVWSLDELNGKGPSGQPRFVNNDYHIAKVRRSLEDLGVLESAVNNSNDWICVNYRGLPNPVHRVVAMASSVLALATLTTILPSMVLIAIVVVLMRQLRTWRRTPKRRKQD